MPSPLKAAMQFALVASILVLGIDALLSLVFQSPPAPEQRLAFYKTHGAFHGAVLLFSALGALLGFLVIRRRLPSPMQNLSLAVLYGLVTSFAAIGAFMLAGPSGAVAWLLLGSMSFAVGSALLNKPWRHRL